MLLAHILYKFYVINRKKDENHWINVGTLAAIVFDLMQFIQNIILMAQFAYAF